MSTNYISAMELTTLLNKTKNLVSNMTLTEHRFLSFLLAQVNKSKMSTHGYLAWPGVERIIEYTGLGDSTIQKLRKTLVSAGWLQYTSGKGPGNSNHYYINAQKIVDCYVRSGNPTPNGIVAPTIIEDEEVRKKQKRNTSGLKSSVQIKQPEVVKVVDKKPPPAIILDTEDPFGADVTSKYEYPKKSLPKNPDGSSPYWPNGERRYSYDDSMSKLEDDPDCPF